LKKTLLPWHFLAKLNEKENKRRKNKRLISRLVPSKVIVVAATGGDNNSVGSGGLFSNSRPFIS
jgi:hypothetical protein